MELSGLHLLLTNRCTFECDHCFVFGSPWQEGVMTLSQIRHILQEAKALGTVKSIYFEGGEPFLYYATLVQGVRDAVEMGFGVGLVTNAYWATSLDDAVESLRPMAGKVNYMSISDDAYHGSSALAANALAAAARLDIAAGTITVAQPEFADAPDSIGQIPEGESGVMYRGRAAEKLAARVPHYPWEQFTECPHEDLRDPGRVHIDPFGHLHLCQGISIGNIFKDSLSAIWARYDPDTHPITGALLAGGPAELARRYALSPAESYADACHLCDAMRRALRPQFPDILTPDQMYGIFGGG